MSLNLNLGCGTKHLDGWVNVDKQAHPAVDHHWDLNRTPWPWPDDSAAKVQMVHVLEHLGETTAVYLNIIRELYRVCKPNAEVFIVVPHPRHDDFLSDPTHVRPITVDGLALFSQKWNRTCIEKGMSNTPLGIHLGVDFEITNVIARLDPTWDDAEGGMSHHNNTIKQLEITLRVVK